MSNHKETPQKNSPTDLPRNIPRATYVSFMDRALRNATFDCKQVERVAVSVDDCPEIHF